MPRMSDEKYTFIQDSKEKKQIARSARHTRTHCGKGGAVKFPSDYLTKKERNAMNGECKSYRLNAPMTWEEFKALPDDLKVVYITALRQKYNVPDKYIAEMMGVKKSALCGLLTKLNLNKGAGHGKRVWDKESFDIWCGKAVVTDAVVTKDDVEKMMPKENNPKVDELTTEEIEEVTVKDDTPQVKTPVYSGRYPWGSDGAEQGESNICHACEVAVPNSGTLTFEGDADSIMWSIKDILRNRYVRLNVQWTVVNDRLDAEKTVTIDTKGLAKAATVIDYALMNEARKAKLGTKG